MTTLQKALLETDAQFKQPFAHTVVTLKLMKAIKDHCFSEPITDEMMLAMSPQMRAAVIGGFALSMAKFCTDQIEAVSAEAVNGKELI